jgi:serine/threonine protein phosphatase PrpC
VIRLKKDDIFFICSDGVWEILPEEILGDCLMESDPEESALVLAQGLLEVNCPDNFSFILQKIDGQQGLENLDVS